MTPPLPSCRPFLFGTRARRYLRNERLGNTLQATALVHEVYLRMVDVTKVEWQQRAQFVAMAGQMMRRILVDAARARGPQERGGMAAKVNIDETAVLSTAPDRVSRLAPASQGGGVALLSRPDRGSGSRYLSATVRRDGDFARRG